MLELKKVHPIGGITENKVEADFNATRDELWVNFEIQSPERYVNPDLPQVGSQWGVWDWDVVEVFVQGPQAYYEFVLSPLDQYFELEIFEPRVKFNREYQSDFKHRTWLLEQGNWSAELRIPWRSLGFAEQPEQYQGNAFAILGEGSNRTYWSLFLPPQQKPDFHLPQYFQYFPW